MLAKQSASPSIRQPGVSEIVVPAWEQSGFELVLPMLAHLSHQAENRWLTWIGHTPLSKSIITEYQFNSANIRLMHSHSDEETLWMMWDALNNGTSAFVIGNFLHTHSVQQKERSQLEVASLRGDSRALILKQPQSQSQF